MSAGVSLTAARDVLWKQEKMQGREIEWRLVC
jgi:hypothetical protein